MILVIIPILALIGVFVYGIVVGETSHPLWQGACTVMVMLIVALIYVIMTISNMDGVTW